MTQQVLNIRGLSVALPKTADRPFAVEDLSLQINAGETLCVVGESGSGKSVTAHAVMRLLPERVLQIQSGEIFLNGKNILDINIEAFRRLRGAWVSMIFQEPMTALNPLMRIGDQIEEALLAHSQQDKSTAREKVLESLREMHLPDPESLQYCYPFQLSGGQRQRVMIAMAMITKPFLLIADEPTTALDVTTQAQILNLIDELKEKHNIAVLFITHDFGVVADIADRVVVMQHGKVVEQGIASQVLHHPQHDYTKKLISALPKIRFGKHFEKKAPEPLLRIEKLNKTYKARGSGLFSRATKRFQALKDVDLHIEVGESLGILGESGSGKTTLGHCVARLLDADSGKIIFAGEDLCQLSA